MTSRKLERPTAQEYAPYYAQYIDLVPEGDVCDLMKQQIVEFEGVLSAIPEEQANVLHEPYTWTIKQAVGHLIDVEKMFGNRAHRFACNDLRPVLGMEHDDYVNNLNYTDPSLSELTVELKCTRRSNLLFLKRIPAPAWNRTGTADGKTMSVRAIAYVLVGHITHHLEIFKERVT